MSNFMSICITKISTPDFLPNFKVVEFEHEFELGDLACSFYASSIQTLTRNNSPFLRLRVTHLRLEFAAKI